MNKLLIFGGTGGLGKKMLPVLEKNFEVIALGSKDCLVNHQAAVMDKIYAVQPDYILNLAARNRDNLLSKIDGTEGDVWLQLSVNCFGAVNIVSSAMKYFKEAKKPGKIILVSSILVSTPVVGAGVYTASKAFIESIGRQAQIEGQRHNIKTTILRLGYCDAGLALEIPPDALKKLMVHHGYPENFPLLSSEKVAERIKDVLLEINGWDMTPFIGLYY